MLGLTDPGVALAYGLCILSALLCIVYGAIHWNRGGETVPPPSPEELKWAEDEEEIEDTVA